LSLQHNIVATGGANAGVTHRLVLHLFVHCAKGRKVPVVARICVILGQIALTTHPELRRRGHASDSGSALFARRSEGSLMSQSLTQLLYAYLPLIVFIGVAGFIGIVLLAVAFVVAYQQPDPEKLSAYECGFNAFDDARMKFDIRFYLVAILFIIFDLEVSFLFPWATAFGKLGVFGFWSMMLFLGVLTIGFIYEWKKGALEWD
jgi:NADH-quinone oxidoreductase subunit A